MSYPNLVFLRAGCTRAKKKTARINTLEDGKPKGSCKLSCCCARSSQAGGQEVECLGNRWTCTTYAVSAHTSQRHTIHSDITRCT